MAKIFKVSGYFVDTNGNYSTEAIYNLIFNGWAELELRHGHTELEEISDCKASRKNW